MAGERAGSIAKSRGQFWAWWVSLLLLLATMLNYMDRQALSVMSKRITGELEISNEQYGDLEFGFGVAFAAGSLVFGAIADRCAVAVSWRTAGVVSDGCADGVVQQFSGVAGVSGAAGFLRVWSLAVCTANDEDDSDGQSATDGEQHFAEWWSIGCDCDSVAGAGDGGWQ
jgi:sugar phosphate permease